MTAPLMRVSELEAELRKLLTEIARLCAAKRTAGNIDTLHRARIELAEVCAAYDTEFSNFQLYVDVCVHPPDRLEVRDQHYRAQVMNEPGSSRQTRMKI